ncbi:type II toxin-antitoxin system HipA family toxin [Aestuariimicrobium soli]|uniref:type II toxin-antitoxin system HipA family toxin n=1 Tax=Aestuariimicrobium soli TaxID=2035834 RepID=UPI003EBF451F
MSPSSEPQVLADVHRGTVLAAQFSSVGPDLRFAYLPDFAGRPLAHTLPVGMSVDRPGRTLPPFFTNLLPEGRRLSALQRALKTSGDDELGLLLAVGEDTVGDVRVVPAGHTPERVEPAVPSGTPLDFAQLASRAGIDRVAVPGVQDKLSAGMITLPLPRGRRAGVDQPDASGASLVKLTPPDYPGAVENEHFALGLATRLGERVVRHELVRDVHGTPGLVVVRFDRVPEPVAVEDACQLLGRYPSDKYLVTAEEVAAVVADVVAAPAVARRSIHRQFVFAWLMGNGDLHAKNVSVVRLPTGEWRVAPIYDTVCTLAWGDTTMALSMGGRVEGFVRRHLVDFGRSIGLPERVAERDVDVALAATSTVDADLEAGALPYDPTTVRRLRRQLGRRRRDALG